MRRSWLAAIFTLAISACGPTGSTVDAGIDGGNSGVADCDDIIAACHHVDPGSGELHDCHENAEGTWKGAACTSNKARCVTLCTNAGHDHDGGHDGG